MDLAAYGSACLIRNSDQQVECRKADNSTTVTLSMPSGQYVDVAVSGFDSPKVCAVTTDHALPCNDGSSDTTVAGNWARIEPLDSGFCGLLVDGSISCFDTYSEITGGIPEGNDFVDLQTSNQAVCAVRASGSVVCWSRNSDGLTGVPAALR